jgi:hypothetical protein
LRISRVQPHRINRLFSLEGLPSKDKFYSSLYESEVKDEDYQRAQKVWDHFEMKTMKDYHDLYLETDVLLLADVFENFRRTCMENYKLDHAHYVSGPSLSWDAFQKKSGENIELVSTVDQIPLFDTMLCFVFSFLGLPYNMNDYKE